MRAHICYASDRAAVDRFLQALARLGVNLDCAGWGLGADVATVMIGGERVAIVSDTWSVDIDGTDQAVRMVIQELNAPGTVSGSARTSRGDGVITALDHVQLAMPPGGEEKARAFFGGLLGMIEETKPAPLLARGGCWFRAGNVVVHVGVEPEFAPQKKAHPALCVRDVKTVAEKLFEAGYPVTRDNTVPDRRRFYTTDPFGNRIEFIQEGEGFSQRS